MHGMKIIVKVQLPIVTNDPSAGALVYNEDRSIMADIPIRSKAERKELLKQLNDDFKGYFYARHDGKGLILTGKAPWQNW